MVKKENRYGEALGITPYRTESPFTFCVLCCSSRHTVVYTDD